MSAPLSEAPVSAPSGSVIAGGRFHAPAWRRSMTAGVWGPVSASTLAPLNPSLNPLLNLDYPVRGVWERRADGSFSENFNVMNSWSGGCQDRSGGRILLPGQGGHSSYGGNESYEMNLLADSPVWTMPLPPSGSKPYIDAEGIPPGATPFYNSYLLDDGNSTGEDGNTDWGEISGRYRDGRPRSTHSYNKWVFVPGQGIVMPNLGPSFSGAGSNAVRATWLLDEASKTWSVKALGPVPGNALAASGGGACYHPESNAIYWLNSGGAKLAKLSLATWAWSNPGATQKVEGGTMKLIAIPGLATHIMTLTAAGLRAWNVATGTFTTVTLLGTGVDLISVDFLYGADWCEKLGCIVIWRGLAGSTGQLFTLTPTGAVTDPWQWGEIVTSGTPPAGTYRGTYGRFGYSPRLNGFWMVCQTSEPTWFMPLD